MADGARGEARARVDHYGAQYGNFAADVYGEIRREVHGQDLGQTSWITAEEQDRFLGELELSPGKRLLDVACGSGGCALRIAAKTGCSAVGIDISEQAVATAKSLAGKQGLSERAEFLVADAMERLPFADEQFDAITCIDAVNHLPDRPRVIAEWGRVLKKGGRLLFTDPVTVTGPLTAEEIAVRSSIGAFLFVPAGYDRRVLEECGFEVLVCEDVTGNMAELAERRRVARAAREPRLREIEGDATYEGQQEFFRVAGLIARERRLARFLYVAEKGGGRPHPSR